ncbi:flagellar hook-basal body complex protein [Gluconacetobacter sacchari]|uniref:flagellar hook-basal body complex protein n=1 Tax=Gluconacetobacter sacchari TaxID=92759 RepID=UPI0039B36AE3
MSVFNALTTAVSGINAQSTAFTNLSNNISNSQTVGYKATTTAFQDFVASSLASTASSDISDSVSAVTVQHVDNQGTASVSTDQLASSISGSGLFVVSKETGATTSAIPQFSSQDYYTRNGEVYKNNEGYLVNTSGYYLDGYMADPKTGTLGTALTQLNVNNIAFRPTQTTTLTLNATVGTLPASSTNPTSTSQTYTTAPVTTYDANGEPHSVGLNWTQNSVNPYVWTVSAYDASGGGAIAANTSTVTFNTNGSIQSVTSGTGASATTVTASGATASIPITATYGSAVQNITLNLGTIGGTSGTTLAAATGTPTAKQVNPLAAGTTAGTLTMPATILGTTTGTAQTYTTVPFDTSATDTTGADAVSAVWTQTPVTGATTNPVWNLTFVNPYTGASLSDSYQVTFDPATGAAASVSDLTPNPNSPTPVPGGLSALALTVGGTAYTANLSNASLSTASTLSTDTSSLTSDSVATGTYQGIQIESDGSVMAQFDTGTQLVGKIALANFANVDGLNAVDGQAYTVTAASGNARIGTVGANGTGTLAVGYVESSTTDLTSDLSALIVAQEAYSANTKVVTTADQLLQTTIAMKQ